VVDDLPAPWGCIGADELIRALFIPLGSYSCSHRQQPSTWQASKKLKCWELTASVAAVMGLV